jgi:hypothetical protein
MSDALRAAVDCGPNSALVQNVTAGLNLAETGLSELETNDYGRRCNDSLHYHPL